jgi:hypothetical protein
MRWPFRSIAREREELLKLRIRDLELKVADASDSAKYFRDRYERLADLMLVRQASPNAVAQVHVEPPPPSATETIGTKVSRVAGLVGSGRGIKFETVKPHASAADLPTR